MAGLHDWLVQLSAAGKGGLDALGFALVFPARVGIKFQLNIPLPADYTGATMRGQVREYPDATTALAEFTCNNEGFSAGVTNFACTLPEGESGVANSVASLGTPPARNAAKDYVVDFLITPAGADEELLMGGILRVLGRATGAPS